MKKLLLITGLAFVFSASNTFAQSKEGIEIKKNSDNQFEIVTVEEVNIDLKLTFQNATDFEIIVKNKKGDTVFAKRYLQKDKAKIAFETDEFEKYTVNLTSNTQEKIVFSTFIDKKILKINHQSKNEYAQSIKN